MKKDELKRYARHLSLENVGLEGQQKLKATKVLVIGAGGLGCPVLQYLTAAGVGMIGVVDHDKVEESNLQRQVLFRTDSIGKFKAEVAADCMKQLNPHVQFEVYVDQLASENALELIKPYDIVIDGTDNFPTRYLVNDACLLLDKPFVHGSIFKFQGQVSVFNYQNGPSYRCLYPTAPNASEAPNCSDVGVLGVLPGVVGTRMAAECLKMILEIGSVLSGKVDVIDLLESATMQMKVQRNAANFNRSALEQQFNARHESAATIEDSISVMDLQSKLAENPSITLLDVRESFELDICAFEKALHIPLGEISQRFNEIPKDKPVIAVCHHGVRSAHAIAYLSELGFKNLSNLEGGIHAWALEVDPNMRTY